MRLTVDLIAILLGNFLKTIIMIKATMSITINNFVANSSLLKPIAKRPRLSAPLNKSDSQEALLSPILSAVSGPIFNQKCHLLDFSLIFVYGFFDY